MYTNKYIDGRHIQILGCICVSSIAISMMWVCTLQHQTGEQYSAVEYTRAKAAVR